MTRVADPIPGLLLTFCTWHGESTPYKFYLGRPACLGHDAASAPIGALSKNTTLARVRKLVQLGFAYFPNRSDPEPMSICISHGERWQGAQSSKVRSPCLIDIGAFAAY